MVALSTTEAKLLALASCCRDIVWARKFVLGLGFVQLKPTDVYEDNTVVALFLLIACTFVVAVSTLLCEYAIFRNSFSKD